MFLLYAKLQSCTVVKKRIDKKKKIKDKRTDKRTVPLKLRPFTSYVIGNI